MVQELKEYTYVLKGKEIREKLGLKGIISHIDLEWKTYNDKDVVEGKTSKVFPELTIHTKDSVDL